MVITNRAPPPPPPAALHGAARGRLDAVDFLQIVAQDLRVLQRQACNLVAQRLCGGRKFCCFGGHGSFPLRIKRALSRYWVSWIVGSHRPVSRPAIGVVGVLSLNSLTQTCTGNQSSGRGFVFGPFALLLELTVELLARTKQRGRQVGAHAQNLARQNAQLLFAARPLADLLHLFRR